MSELMYDRDLWRIPGVNLTPNARLDNLSTMKSKARAEILAEVQDPQGLFYLTRLCEKKGYPLLMLGGGSNTIFATSYFEGVVVQLNSPVFNSMEAVKNNVIRVGAGSKLTGLLSYTRKVDMMGLEFCTMIPGTVGGALAGNAGAGNWGLCDFVDSVLVMTRDGEIGEIRRNEFRYSYRHSDLSEYIILEAEVRLEKYVEEISKARSREFRDKKKTQPYNLPNTGCIFKNPIDPRTGNLVSAGKLIDEAGLKNYTINGSCVSEGHANFIVNQGKACGEDFLALISLIQDIIFERTGIELELEAKIVGGPLTSCVL